MKVFFAQMPGVVGVRPVAFGLPSALAAQPLAQMQRATTPQPVMDLSSVTFSHVIRNDGQGVLIGNLGQAVIPQVLTPGGIELPPLMLPGKSINIATIGDSGRGNDSQRWVADRIAEAARARNCNFFVHVGDLFYPHGLEGIDDPQLRTKYLDCYGGLPHPHAILGNHEYGNSKAGGRPDALIAAAAKHMPGMFEMPQRYYSRRVYCDGFMVRMLFLDTSTLAVDPTQLAWIERELAKNSDYTVVFGHHAILNSGWHGDSMILKKILLPLLEGHADLYVCGHEHNQQFHRSEKGLPHVISGAGCEAYPVNPFGRAEFSSIRRGGAFLTIDRHAIKYEAIAAKTAASMYTTTFARRVRVPTLGAQSAH